MKEFLINENINKSEFICINKNKENLGLITKEEALKIADKDGLDLILINDSPAIVKIIDYKKFMFEESKKNKPQKIIQNKEVQFSINIEEHDFKVKLNKIKLFISKKHPVLLKIQFKGRELNHPEIGFDLVNKILEELKDLIKYDKKPELKNKSIVFLIQHR